MSQQLRELAAAPLDAESVQSLFLTLEEHLESLGQALQTIAETGQQGRDQSLWWEDEQRVTRYVSEMRWKIHLPSPLLIRISDFLAERRIERGYRPARFRELESGTAFDLVQQVMRRAESVWRGICDTTALQRQQQMVRQTSATQVFFQNYSSEFVPLESLIALVQEEAAIARLVFRPPGLAMPPSVPDVVSSPPEPPPGEATPGIPAASTHVSPEIRVKRRNGHQPRLANWAVATLDGKKWILFQHRKSGWRPRRKLPVPQGNPAQLLLKLAEKQGFMSIAEACDALRGAYPGLNAAELKRRVSDGLAKLKRSIREKIAQCVQCAVNDVRNLIPNVGSAWRAAVRICFGRMGDDGKPQLVEGPDLSAD